MRFDDFEDYWGFQSQVSGTLALLISSLPGDAVEAIRSSLEPALAPFQSGTGYDIPSLAIGATGAARSRT
jgi:hypothetical protein